MAKINTLNYQTVASWNGSQDLFIVEQPDGTKVATPAMVKQYVLNNMDEVPTQDSNNPVKSGGIFSTMAVPKYDATNRREYYEGGAAFSGNIDSTPTAGSNNAVASGGTKTYVDNAVSQLNKIKIVSATTQTTADGIGAVFYNSDIKRGKVIGVYLDNPSSTYRFCTMMVSTANAVDRFYIFVYNYNLAPVTNTTVTLRVVCYE